MASKNTASRFPSQQVQSLHCPLSIHLRVTFPVMSAHTDLTQLKDSPPVLCWPKFLYLLSILAVISTLRLHSQNLLWEIDPRQGVRRSRKSACEDPVPHDLKKSHLWVWEDGSVGKGRCIQARGSKLGSYKAHDNQRKWSSARCPLTVSLTCGECAF